VAIPARDDVEHLAAQQALGFDRGLGAVSQEDGLVDTERDQHTGPVEFDA
jgi:hypothetical protein